MLLLKNAKPFTPSLIHSVAFCHDIHLLAYGYMRLVCFLRLKKELKLKPLASVVVNQRSVLLESTYIHSNLLTARSENKNTLRSVHHLRVNPQPLG